MFAGEGIFIRRPHVENGQIFFKLLDMSPGKFSQIQTGFFGSLDGLIIQIGDIHDMPHPIAPILQIPAQLIGKHITSHFAYMHPRMGRRTVRV